VPAGWLQATTDWKKYYENFDRIMYGKVSDAVQDGCQEEGAAQEKEKAEKAEKEIGLP